FFNQEATCDVSGEGASQIANDPISVTQQPFPTNPTGNGLNDTDSEEVKKLKNQMEHGTSKSTADSPHWFDDWDLGCCRICLLNNHNTSLNDSTGCCDCNGCDCNVCDSGNCDCVDCFESLLQ
ncbi:unnamed protein product, partial [Rotaria magnacalcarata]